MELAYFQTWNPQTCSLQTRGPRKVLTKLLIPTFSGEQPFLQLKKTRSLTILKTWKTHPHHCFQQLNSKTTMMKTDLGIARSWRRLKKFKTIQKKALFNFPTKKTVQFCWNSKSLNSKRAATNSSKTLKSCSKSKNRPTSNTSLWDLLQLKKAYFLAFWSREEAKWNTFMEKNKMWKLVPFTRKRTPLQKLCSNSK